MSLKAVVDLRPSALQTSAMQKDDLAAKITKVIEGIPDWLRQDLISKDPIVRARAEETLSVMITAAVSSPDS